MSTRIQTRRGTAAAWTSANPILAQGEPGLETDTGRRKVGDGTTAWTGLTYEFDATQANATFVPQTQTVNAHPLTGPVTLVKADVGLGNVDNTADVAKPISTATQAALNLKATTVYADAAVAAQHTADNAVYAPLISAHLTGSPTVNGVAIASAVAISLTDNGDGTFALAGAAVADNGDGTYSMTA